MRQARKRRLAATALALAALAWAIGATPAAGKSLGQMPATRGVLTPDSAYRYVAISPRSEDRVTVLERIRREDGVVVHWWRLPGSYFVPGVAFDGSGGGLSGDGSTLVLGSTPRTYPPRRSRFAAIHLDRYRGRARGVGDPQPKGAVAFHSLHGDFAVLAISPDGSELFLSQHFPGADRSNVDRYLIRACDLDTRTLRSRPIGDPEVGSGPMSGLPVARANSRDGRWAYTLYDGGFAPRRGADGSPPARGIPYLSALDTVSGHLRTVALPQLRREPHTLYLTRLRRVDGGAALEAIRRGGALRSPRAVLRIDAGSLSVAPLARGGDGGRATWPEWALAALAAATLAALLAYARRRSRRPGATPLGGS